MTNKSDPLSVLLAVKTQMNIDVDDDLVKACYQLLCDHQYDKEPDTTKQIHELVEKALLANEGDVIL